jgi:hypothetical protein
MGAAGRPLPSSPNVPQPRLEPLRPLGGRALEAGAHQCRGSGCARRRSSIGGRGGGASRILTLPGVTSPGVTSSRRGLGIAVFGPSSGQSERTPPPTVERGRCGSRRAVRRGVAPMSPGGIRLDGAPVGCRRSGRGGGGSGPYRKWAEGVELARGFEPLTYGRALHDGRRAGPLLPHLRHRSLIATCGRASLSSSAPRSWPGPSASRSSMSNREDG